MTNMPNLNLIHDNWIHVVVDQKGTTEMVSIKELFERAHEIIDISGDTLVQDFAILRQLLAITQTVYSRYDADGTIYDDIELDEQGLPVGEIDDEENYKMDLLETWETIWENQMFTEQLFDYLDEWAYKFEVFDFIHPFMQVTEETIAPENINSKNAGKVYGRTLDRRLSESANKRNLTSPYGDSVKGVLSEDEVARWMITYHGYSATAEKTKHLKNLNEFTYSKGWLYDLGGIHLKGETLFQTLWLNTMLVHPYETIGVTHQRPTWEISGIEAMDNRLEYKAIDNLAELYTVFSRALFIDPEIDLDKQFVMQSVKIPEVPHVNNFLEPMTLWNYNNSGDSKGSFTPRKHRESENFWQNFGLITQPSTNREKEEHVRPIIMDWLYETVEEYLTDDYQIQIQAITLLDDGNATSWKPTGVVDGKIIAETSVLSDVLDQGWVIRINQAIATTKHAIGKNYRKFLWDIADIRNYGDGNEFINSGVDSVYAQITDSFNEWLMNITFNDSKDEKVKEWYDMLYEILLHEADAQMTNHSNKDVIGVETAKGVKNIFTAHNSFRYFLHGTLKGGETNVEA